MTDIWCVILERELLWFFGVETPDLMREIGGFVCAALVLEP